jgi:RNA polymerase sigma-70 factor (ECF subfamily)
MFGLLLAMGSRSSDTELVRRFKAGDREAFSVLANRHQHRVYGLCLRMLGSSQEAEEVSQDVFLSLYRALPRFRGDSKLTTWMYRVTLNHCKNHELYRRRRGHGRHEPLDGTREDGPPRELPHHGPATDASVHRLEAGDLLQDALNQLDDDHRKIVLLRDVEDLSYEEISDLLDIPRGTVKSRLHRARAELARRLNRQVDRADVL